MSKLVVFRNGGPPGGAFTADDQQNGASYLSPDYLRARERAERAAAKRASSPAARGVHQELAQAYAAMVRVGAGSDLK